MIDPILEALVLYSGAGFLFYRAWQRRDFAKCLPASMVAIIALTAWPCLIPMKVALIIVCLVALIFLPFLKMKGLLKRKDVIWNYSVLIFLGLVYVTIKLLYNL